MEILGIFLFAILGLAVGSFLNVCIDRLPRNESIVIPPSHCSVCQHKLAAKDLIPVFSYLRLRGRCRYCQAAIPRRLFWVELATALIFAFLYWHYGLNPSGSWGLWLSTPAYSLSFSSLTWSRGSYSTRSFIPAWLWLCFWLYIPGPGLAIR